MRSLTKLGLGLFVVSFFSIGALHRTAEDLEAESAGSARTTVCLRPGAPWRAVLSGSFRSWRGVHEVVTPAARFFPAVGDPVDLDVQAIDERPMLAAAAVDSTDFDAKLLEEPVEPTFLVQVPNSLAGSSGEIKLSGAMMLSEVAVDREQNSYTLGVNPRTLDETFAVSIDGSADGSSADGGSSPEPPGASGPSGASAKKLRLYGALEGAASLTLMLSILLMLWSGIGIRLFVTSCVLIGVPSALLPFLVPEADRGLGLGEDEGEREPGVSSVERALAGSAFTIRPSLTISTVDSFHRITYLSAWIKGLGGDQVEVAAKPTGNKSWPDPIEVGYVRVGPIFKTNRFRVHPSLSVDLPSAEEVGGKAVTLVVHGVIVYPDLGSLEILNPIDIEYETSALSFREAIELDFRPEPAAPEKRQKSVLESLLITSAALGGCLLTFGMLRGIKRAIFG